MREARAVVIGHALAGEEQNLERAGDRINVTETAINPLVSALVAPQGGGAGGERLGELEQRGPLKRGREQVQDGIDPPDARRSHRGR